MARACTGDYNARRGQLLSSKYRTGTAKPYAAGNVVLGKSVHDGIARGGPVDV